jgi:hypothetical protein
MGSSTPGMPLLPLPRLRSRSLFFWPDTDNDVVAEVEVEVPLVVPRDLVGEGESEDRYR